MISNCQFMVLSLQPLADPTIDSEQIEVYNADTQMWELIGRKIIHHDRHYFTSVIIPVKDLEVSVIEQTTRITSTTTTTTTTVTSATTESTTTTKTTTTDTASTTTK